MYHNSGDLTDREGFDWEQLWLISKVQVWFRLDMVLVSDVCD
jgi:hypothetical protein